MKKLESWENLVREIKPGTCLWRDFAISGTDGVRIADVPFTQTERGNYMARVEFLSNWLFEPTVWNRTSKPHGVIVFVDKIPPDDWTHLIVKKTSHNGKSLAATYGGPLPGLDAYKRFCWESYKLRSETLNAEVEHKIKTGMSIQIDIPVDQHRMTVSSYWHGQGFRPAYQY